MPRTVDTRTTSERDTRTTSEARRSINTVHMASAHVRNTRVCSHWSRIRSLCARGEGLFTTADRNRFTATGEEYTKLTNSLLDAMNAAATKGDTAGIGTTTEPIFTQIQQKITDMKDQAAKLKGDPQKVANELIAIAERWVTAAKSAVDAGKKSDATAYNEAIAKVNVIATEFNLKIGEWNAIQAK